MATAYTTLLLAQQYKPCCAARVKGSVPHTILATKKSDTNGVIIGHPGGIMEVSSKVVRFSGGHWRTEFAEILRTARIIFSGEVEL